jgi:hypothetical protein
VTGQGKLYLIIITTCSPTEKSQVCTIRSQRRELPRTIRVT